jgi:hypothetical protein
VAARAPSRQQARPELLLSSKTHAPTSRNPNQLSTLSLSARTEATRSVAQSPRHPAMVPFVLSDDAAFYTWVAITWALTADVAVVMVRGWANGRGLCFEDVFVGPAPLPCLSPRCSTSSPSGC